MDSKGHYILVLYLQKGRTIQIGRLGPIHFKPQYYAYVGSALGSGGVPARVRRHLRPANEKRTHWHIDALIQLAEIVEVWWSYDMESQECTWAQILASMGRRFCPSFGASDCRCPGHLFAFNDEQLVDQTFMTLREKIRNVLHRVRIGSADRSPLKQNTETSHAKENTNLSRRRIANSSAQ